MSEQEVYTILARALDQGMLLSFTRMSNGGWQIREPKGAPRLLSKADIASFARRLSSRA